MRRKDDAEQEAIRATAKELIAGGWTPGTAYAYATRTVLGGSSRLTQKLQNGGWADARGRRTAAGGGWSGSNASLESGPLGSRADGRLTRREKGLVEAQRREDAGRVAATSARRKLA